MPQICPNCKKLVPDEDTICPHCNNKLTSENETCPYCNQQISSEDTVCPHCNRLLTGEYQKQVTAKINKVLFPLAALLLLSAGVYLYLEWREILLNRVVVGIFVFIWLLGFVLYGAYMGKGDKDFWWGK